MLLGLATASPGRPESGSPLPEELLPRLARLAERYEDAARRFTCKETVRRAAYRGHDRPYRQTSTTYDYLLVRPRGGHGLRELRTGGRPRSSRRMPPVYAWTLLFSEFHQPYFSYRDLGEELYGFGLVRRIGFRGSVPYSDGSDIRQWEGIALLDVRTWMPLEVVAEPLSQSDLLLQRYLDYKKSPRIALSFHWIRLATFRIGKRPFGRRLRARFRRERNGLQMPWLLEAEKFRMVSPAKTLPWSFSSREYADYRYFETDALEITRRKGAR